MAAESRGGGFPHASLRADGHPRPRARGAHRRPALDQFLNVVRKDGGTVEKVDIWGRRRLVYEINKKTEGIYAVVDLQAEPATVKELDRQLNLNEAVLRTKVLRPDHATVGPNDHPWPRRHRHHRRRQPRRRPRAALHPERCGRRELPHRVDPAVPRQADQRVEGRRQPLPPLLRLAAGGRERRRVAPARHARHRPGPAQAAVLRDQGRREAHRLRDRRRRGRPEPAQYATAKVTKTQRGGGGGGFGGGGGGRQRPVGLGSPGRRHRPAGGGGGGGWNAPGASDEPPF